LDAAALAVAVARAAPEKDLAADVATRIEDAAELAPGALTRMSGMARASLRSPCSSARILAAADVTSSRRLMVYSLLTWSPASVAAS
jgi:hypothetical protein